MPYKCCEQVLWALMGPLRTCWPVWVATLYDPAAPCQSVQCRLTMWIWDIRASLWLGPWSWNVSGGPTFMRISSGSYGLATCVKNASCARYACHPSLQNPHRYLWRSTLIPCTCPHQAGSNISFKLVALLLTIQNTKHCDKRQLGL